MARRGLFGLLALLFVARFDLWAFDDPSLVLGLPVGLLYHAVYCGAAALVLWALGKWAWPTDLEMPEDSEGNP